MVIAVDFDATICTYSLSGVGQDIGAFPVLKKLLQNNHKLILMTMRDGNDLKEAVEYCKKKGVEFEWVNKNPQASWTTSPKIYANLYIDDHGINAPLIYNPEISHRPFIDWKKINDILVDMKLIEE